MRYNLHTHTFRCNHATGEDREYVEAAIEAGIEVLGFSDHCPQFFPTPNYYSYFRMHPEDLDGYVASVRELQKEYKDDIKILLGLEAEYYPETYDKFIKFIKPYRLDYMIMGQHFVGNEYDKDSFYAPRPNLEANLIDRYVEQVCDGLRMGVFSYLAHPDIIYYEGDPAYYREKMKELCVMAKDMRVPLEYNILGHVNKKGYPRPEFWKIAAETGNDVVIGYDAHYPDALKQEEAFYTCFLNLNTLGISPLDFERIKLRRV